MIGLILPQNRVFVNLMYFLLIIEKEKEDALLSEVVSEEEANNILNSLSNNFDIDNIESKKKIL